MTQVCREHHAKGSLCDSTMACYVKIPCAGRENLLAQEPVYKQYNTVKLSLNNCMLCFFLVMSLLKHAISPLAFSLNDPAESCSDGVSLSCMLPADGALKPQQLYHLRLPLSHRKVRSGVVSCTL